MKTRTILETGKAHLHYNRKTVKFPNGANRQAFNIGIYFGKERLGYVWYDVSKVFSYWDSEYLMVNGISVKKEYQRLGLASLLLKWLEADYCDFVSEMRTNAATKSGKALIVKDGWRWWKEAGYWYKRFELIRDQHANALITIGRLATGKYSAEEVRQLVQYIKLPLVMQAKGN